MRDGPGWLAAVVVRPSAGIGAGVVRVWWCHTSWAAEAVTALVDGSRAKPYRVRIAVDPFPELAWAKVELALAEQALHSAVAGR